MALVVNGNGVCLGTCPSCKECVCADLSGSCREVVAERLVVLPMQLLVLNAAIGDAAAPGASLQGGGLKGVIATVGCCTANHTAAPIIVWCRLDSLSIIKVHF